MDHVHMTEKLCQFVEQESISLRAVQIRHQNVDDLMPLCFGIFTADIIAFRKQAQKCGCQSSDI
jgi:hypothetical protein